MRIFPHIKKNLRAFLRDGKVTLVCFIIFPMVMAAVYGNMQKNAFSGKSSFEAIKVQFAYDKASKEGEILTNILAADSVKSFIQPVEGDGKCKITISGDFKDIKIEKLSGTDNEMDMVKGFMKAFSENINQEKVVMDNISALKLTPAEQADLTSRLAAGMKELRQTSAVKEEIMPGYRTLGAREYYTISMFSYTSIIMITILVKGFHKDKKRGLIRRSFSTPNSKESYLLGYLSSTFILCFAVNLIYVIINKVMGIAFLEDIAGVLLLIILQSLLQAAVIGALVSFISNEKLSDTIMTVIILVPSVFGGVFFNADIIEVKALKVISDFSPNSLILNSYKGLSLMQGISGAQTQILISIILSVILLSASIIKVRAGWEES